MTVQTYHFDEKWRDVVGYEGIYEVSDYGRVRTHKDKTTHSVRHGTRKWEQRILKNKTPNGRDVRVSLWKDKKPKDFLVHRLVAFAFIPTVEGKCSINHKDGNPKNNHVSNLEWCNHYENNNHAFDNGLIPSDKTLLTKTDTGEQYKFRSMQQASFFLNRSRGYISALAKRQEQIATCKQGHTYRIKVY